MKCRHNKTKVTTITSKNRNINTQKKHINTHNKTKNLKKI